MKIRYTRGAWTLFRRFKKSFTPIKKDFLPRYSEEMYITERRRLLDVIRKARKDGDEQCLMAARDLILATRLFRQVNRS